MATKTSKATTGAQAVTQHRALINRIKAENRRAADWEAAEDAGVLGPLQTPKAAKPRPPRQVGTPSRVERFIDELLGERAAIGTVTQDDAARMVDGLTGIRPMSAEETDDYISKHGVHPADQALDDWWMANTDLIERRYVEAGVHPDKAAAIVDRLEAGEDSDPTAQRFLIANERARLTRLEAEATRERHKRLMAQDTGEMVIDL